MYCVRPMNRARVLGGRSAYRRGVAWRGSMTMTNLNENDLAVLELLVMAPRDFFPPQAMRVVRKLLKRGLAVCDQGEWYVTRAGLRLVHHTLH